MSDPVDPLRERAETLLKDITPGRWRAWAGVGWPKTWAEMMRIPSDGTAWPVASDDGQFDGGFPIGCVACVSITADQMFIAEAPQLVRDLLTDRASLQARIRELERERLIAEGNARAFEQEWADDQEVYDATRDEVQSLRAQLAAAEAREQAVKEVLAGFRADKARWDGLAEKVGPNNSDEADAGDMMRIVTSTLTNVIVKLEAALASTGQPQEGQS